MKLIQLLNLYLQELGWIKFTNLMRATQRQCGGVNIGDNNAKELQFEIVFAFFLVVFAQIGLCPETCFL